MRSISPRLLAVGLLLLIWATWSLAGELPGGPKQGEASIGDQDIGIVE